MADSEVEARPSITATAISLISIGSGLSVIVSALYNVAYFSRLGFFSPELLTSGDLVNSCLTWVPLVAPLVFFGLTASIFLDLVFTRLNAKARAEIAAAKAAGSYPASNPYRLMLRKDVPFVVMGSLLALFYSMAEATDEWIGALTLAVVFVWPPILWAARRLDPDSKIYNANVWYFLGVLPWLFTMAYDRGNTAARSQLADDRSPSVHMTVKGKDLQGSLLRTFEKGALIKSANGKQLIFIPWGQIDLISSVLETPSNKLRLCAWTGIACFPPGVKGASLP